jgi:hypothetical protein
LTNDLEYGKWQAVARRLSKSSLQVYRLEADNNHLIDSGDEKDYATYRNLRRNLINNEAMKLFDSLQENNFGYNTLKRYKERRTPSRSSSRRVRVSININNIFWLSNSC